MVAGLGRTCASKPATQHRSKSWHGVTRRLHCRVRGLNRARWLAQNTVFRSVRRILTATGLHVLVPREVGGFDWVRTASGVYVPVVRHESSPSTAVTQPPRAAYAIIESFLCAS